MRPALLATLAALAIIATAAPAMAKPDDGLCILLQLDKDTTAAISAQEPTTENLKAHAAEFTAASKTCGITTLNYQLLGDMAASQYWGHRLTTQGIEITILSGNWKALPADTKKRFDALLLKSGQIAGDDLTFVQSTLATIERDVSVVGGTDTTNREAAFSWLVAIVMMARDEGG
ncbi:MAG: hypothetical protein JWM33_3007 [Caulobacteraceae bacterium]|nr:hypothetical protein [Caulobacteraceae bacterium]